MLNRGERNELLIKLKLIELRDKKESILVDGILTPIKSVGFEGVEYKSTNGLWDYSSFFKNWINITEFCKEFNIYLTTSNSKSDVYINNKGFSLKSLANYSPSIVPPTPRFNFIKLCDKLELNIRDFDEDILKYIELRNSKLFFENLNNESNISPFTCNFKKWKPIIDYFLFQGTSTKLCKNKADYLLTFTSPIRPDSWVILTPENASLHIWNKLVFSIVDKGIPSSFPNLKEPENSQIKPWIHQYKGKTKGSLEIRLLTESSEIYFR